MPVPEIKDILDSLSKSPRLAAEEFAAWAYALLTQAPFRELRGLDADMRQDATEEIIMHCISDDCQTLRKFGGTADGFLWWFLRVAKNKTIDVIRRSAYRPAGDEIHDRDGATTSNTPVEDRDLLDTVWKSIKSLRSKCQTLLLLAAQEFTPKEMTVVLGLPPTSNQKVADDLRYCRRQLVALLEKKGIAADDLL